MLVLCLYHSINLSPYCHAPSFSLSLMLSLHPQFLRSSRSITASVWILPPCSSNPSRGWACTSCYWGTSRSLPRRRGWPRPCWTRRCSSRRTFLAEPTTPWRWAVSMVTMEIYTSTGNCYYRSDVSPGVVLQHKLLAISKIVVVVL